MVNKHSKKIEKQYIDSMCAHREKGLQVAKMFWKTNLVKILIKLFNVSIF